MHSMKTLKKVKAAKVTKKKRRNNHIVPASKKMTKTTEMKRDPLSKEKKAKTELG